MSTVSVRLIRKLDELEGLRDIWDVLLKRSASDNLFLSWEWISTWSRVYLKGDELFVIVVYEGEEIVAIAPWWLDKQRVAGLFALRKLRFLGTGDVCSDYLDIIVDPNGHDEWLRAIWDQLFGPLRKEWDVWDYSDVPANSKALLRLYRWADDDDRCLTRQIKAMTICPYLNLPANEHELVARLSGHHRYAINSSRRLLEKRGAVTFRFCERSADVLSEMQRLRDLNTRIWTERGHSGSFVNDNFVRFHDEVAQSMLRAGRLVLCSLRINDSHVGSFYGLQHGHVLYYYIMSVEKSHGNRINAGDLLLTECMLESIRRGCLEFDFLRGDESYKYRWTQTDRRNLGLSIYNKRLGAALDIVAHSSRDAARSGAKVLARSLAATPKNTSPQRA